MQLAISSDMLVAGRHFFPMPTPAAGHAPGRQPVRPGRHGRAADRLHAGAGLPEARADWLAPFSQGMLALADAMAAKLIGGDTTKAR
jgi:thiamine-monophosphate kinase